MRTERRPKQVEDARRSGNHDALSRMGRKGAIVSAESKRLQKEEEERIERDALLEQSKLYSVSEDGDVLPPDPNSTSLEE